MLSFEHDPGLDDLLPTERRGQLRNLLERLTGTGVELHDSPLDGAVPIEFNLETVAWVNCPQRAEIQPAIAGLVEFVLHFVGKYRMAANLHNDATEASFAELQRQNAALQASEARYKALSEQLQERVDAQVKVIETAQQQLYESARLRAVGQLAAGVAHEINNPIGFIISNMRVASDYLDDLGNRSVRDTATAELLDDFKALINESADGARRIASIVADLKTISNIDQTDFVRGDINALIASTCHLFETRKPETVRLAFMPGQIPEIRIYPAKLSQAFYNIIDNAIKAVSHDGNVSVTTMANDGSVEIAVDDDGCGVPDDILAKIFDPFFTTRPVGEGAGLGLTVARDIVAAHKGSLQLIGRESGGTRVSIRLPSS